MPALLLKVLPYAVLAIVAGIIGGTATHKVDSARYNALQATFSKYQSEVAQANEAAQKAYAAALQGQIDARSKADANNADIIAKLTTEKDNLAGSLEFTRRLLGALKAAAPAGGTQVPAPGHQPAAPEGPRASGNRPVAELLGSAAAECRHNTEQLAALEAELIPQLR